MVLENMEPIFNFLFCDLPSLCLVLSQEAWNELLDEKGVSVSKFGGRGTWHQFLKVLRFRLWLSVPPLEGFPHGCWPTLETTLLIDDGPAKSVLNPPGNVIFPDPWTGDRKNTSFVNKLAPYIRRLVVHLESVLDFVRSNPISNAAISPRDNVYRSIHWLAKFNKLIWKAFVHVVASMWFNYLMFVQCLNYCWLPIVPPSMWHPCPQPPLTTPLVP